MKFVVVDDDPQVCQIVCLWLVDFGEAIGCADLETAREFHGVDAFVVDLTVLGDMYSWQHSHRAIAALLDHHPGALVILLTALGLNPIEDILQDIERLGHPHPKHVQKGRNARSELIDLLTHLEVAS